MKILFLDSYTANPGDLSWSEFEALGSCTYFDRTPAAEIIARAADAEVIITNKAPLNRAKIEALPKLKYIGVIATGYNVVDVIAAQERGITVTNVPGYSTPSVAQAAFSLLLELTNNTGHSTSAVREGRWSACPDFCFWDRPIIELSGLTLGLIGLGDIGSATARIAQAFGMKVIAARRTWALPPPTGIEPTTIEDVLRRADVVSLHCPLTDETKHLINATNLALMKPSAYLINTARGPLIDDAALANALNNDQLAGAGLDVLSTEPPPAGNPLFSAKNCLITPHIAWASKASRERLIASAANNLKQWKAGSAVNVV